MPLWYKGIIEEHSAVRNCAGLFDVSHMGRFLIEGREATNFLEYILPTNVAKVKTGRAFYSVLCNENGGIIDDTVTNKISNEKYMMVVNASNRDKDFSWLENHSRKFSIDLEDQSDEIALIAFQGPLVASLLQKICSVDLNAIKRFGLAYCQVKGKESLISRTGYTGEDGFEIAVLDTPLEDPTKAEEIWSKLLDLGREKGAMACGLGARDLLRLEAGMCLYGQDIDETTSPIEASLSNIIDLKKEVQFLGRTVIEGKVRNSTERKRVCFIMDQGGIPRHGYDIVFGGNKVGVVTSGSYSPLLKKGIGMAYVIAIRSDMGQTLSVRLKSSDRRASIVKTPFYDTSKYGYSRLTSV